MKKVNIVVVESFKKAKRLTDNYFQYKKENPDFKDNYVFVATAGSINEFKIPSKLSLDPDNQPTLTELKNPQDDKDKIEYLLNDTALSKSLLDRKKPNEKYFNPWKDQKLQFIISADPDREGAGIAKGVDKFVKELNGIGDEPMNILPNKFIHVESYSFKSLLKGINSPKLKNNYDEKLATEQLVRSAGDKFIGFSSSQWNKNTKVAVGRVQMGLLRILERNIDNDDKTRVIRMKHTNIAKKGFPQSDDESFKKIILKDEISVEEIINPNNNLIVKYEPIKKDQSYLVNLIDLEMLTNCDTDKPISECYRAITSLYLGVPVNAGGGTAYVSAMNYPRTDSKVVSDPQKFTNLQLKDINREISGLNDDGYGYEFPKPNALKERKFNNQNNISENPYIQEGHEALLPNFFSLTPDAFALATIVEPSNNPKDLAKNKKNKWVENVAYNRLYNQSIGTLITDPNIKEVKFYLVDEKGKEKELELRIPELVRDIPYAKIKKITGYVPEPNTSELNLLCGMVDNHIGRPSTYHQISSNLEKFKNKGVITDLPNGGHHIERKGYDLLFDTQDNPFLQLDSTKKMEAELSELPAIKGGDEEAIDKIAEHILDINQKVADSPRPKILKHNQVKNKPNKHKIF